MDTLKNNRQRSPSVLLAISSLCVIAAAVYAVGYLGEEKTSAVEPRDRATESAIKTTAALAIESAPTPTPMPDIPINAAKKVEAAPSYLPTPNANVANAVPPSKLPRSLAAETAERSARNTIDAAIQTGRWTEADRDQLRRQMTVLDDEGKLSVLTMLATAITDGKLPANGLDGIPF